MIITLPRKAPAAAHIICFVVYANCFTVSLAVSLTVLAEAASKFFTLNVTPMQEKKSCVINFFK
jgi:hypothetical protein